MNTHDNLLEAAVEFIFEMIVISLLFSLLYSRAFQL